MPKLPPKRCIHPLCDDVATYHSYCDKHKPKQNKRLYERSALSKDNDKFYNSSYWKTTRRQILMKYPLCEYCKKEGVLTEATVVDHIIRRSHYEGSPYDHKNLQALCESCHSIKTNKESQYYENDTWNTEKNPYWIQKNVISY
jgi:5-methylcytosine-specific restriction protein A